MATIVTYVCDCCGGESTSLSKFEPQPITANLGSWMVTVQSALLCTICFPLILEAAMTEAQTQQGIRAGTQLP